MKVVSPRRLSLAVSPLSPVLSSLACVLHRSGTPRSRSPRWLRRALSQSLSPCQTCYGSPGTFTPRPLFGRPVRISHLGATPGGRSPRRHTGVMPVGCARALLSAYHSTRIGSCPSKLVDSSRQRQPPVPYGSPYTYIPLLSGEPPSRSSRPGARTISQSSDPIERLLRSPVAYPVWGCVCSARQRSPRTRRGQSDTARIRSCRWRLVMCSASSLCVSSGRHPTDCRMMTHKHH